MVEIRNLANEELGQKYLLKAADAVLKGENILGQDLSIVFINSSEMAKINYEHLGKGGPTDVLSFKLDNEDWVEGAGKKELGEIFICLEEIKKNKSPKEQLDKEIIRVLIHGVLHLCGYDHKKSEEARIMEKKEIFYLSNIW